MTAAAESPEDLVLAGEFAEPTREQWRELVVGVLEKGGREIGDGTDPESLLETGTDDGYVIRPLYAAEDAPDVGTGVPGRSPFVRGARAEAGVAMGWQVRQRQTFAADASPDQAHEQILFELERGVSSLWLALGDGGGPPVETMAALLEDVFLDLAPVALDAGRDTPAAARELLRLAEEKGTDAAALVGSLGFDPLLAATRGGPEPDAGYREAMVELSRTAAGRHPLLRTVVADALPFHSAGASDGQELGAVLAAGLHAVRLLVGDTADGGGGLSVDEAFARVEFRLAATADQFATIAKLRAARRCWDRVGEVAGASEAARAMAIHAVSSPAMMTARDPWVNMLRTTVATFAAGVGGADAITVLPFDAVLGMPDAFARRIARNTQALLLEESHLAHVIDPAGGSWYVESRTDSLAHAGWEAFTAIERDGGIDAALADGALAARFDETWQTRRDRIAHRRDPLTGVSEFPNLHEERPGRTPYPRSGAEPGHGSSPSGTADREGGLPVHRYGEVFEALRNRADRADERPKVFLAVIGQLAQYTARSTFTTNLFHAGGIDVVTGPGGTDPDEIAAAFRESGTPVAVLASGDKVYAEHAAPVLAALREAGATRVLLAGKKEAAGLEDGSDVVDFAVGGDAAGLLESTLDDLGVPA